LVYGREEEEIDMDGKGTYRTHGTGGTPDTARVVDRSVAFDLPEQLYRRRGYSPPFEELSWKPGVDGAIA
jgi:hypothetical protein